MKVWRVVAVTLLVALLSWSLTSASSERNIELTINSNIALVNGNEVQLDVAPFIKDGRTFIPLRFVSEELGGEVSYTTKADGTVDKVFVRMPLTDGSSTSPTPPLTDQPSSLRAEVNGVVLAVLSISKAAKHDMWVPEEGDIFLDLEVMFENVSREGEFSVNRLYFALEDGAGHEYGYVWLGGKDPQIELTKLTKGQKTSGYVTFSVPEGSSGFTLVYRDMSEHPFRIPLGI